jgi:hypothetical protein
VLLASGDAQLGRAVVEDIAEGQAVARVVSTQAPSVDLPDHAAALVADAEHLPAIAAHVFGASLP